MVSVLSSQGREQLVYGRGLGPKQYRLRQNHFSPETLALIAQAKEKAITEQEKGESWDEIASRIKVSLKTFATESRA